MDIRKSYSECALFNYDILKKFIDRLIKLKMLRLGKIFSL